MKKLLVFSHAMELGGAESALLGLLENVDRSDYEVDLFLMRHSGELMKYIPDGINLLPENGKYKMLMSSVKDCITSGHPVIAFLRVIGKLAANIKAKKLGLPKDNIVSLEYLHKFTKCAMPDVSDKEYDAVISFLTPHYFAAEKVRAKKKIAWIHTDYSAVGIDRESETKMWGKYDRIAAISADAAQGFVGCFPELAEKVAVIENILPMKYISSRSDEFNPVDEMPDDGRIKILSVGRFCNAKRFDEVPLILKKTRDAGVDAVWYLIGFGGDEALIRQRIAESGMEDYVKILGRKDNPYPYIKACDVYCQPSRYEGKSVAVREAQALCKPVVITEYATSGSQLENGVDGVIVPMDVDGCARGIAASALDTELLQKLIGNTQKKDYSNSEEIKKIYWLIEENEKNFTA